MVNLCLDEDEINPDDIVLTTGQFATVTNAVPTNKKFQFSPETSLQKLNQSQRPRYDPLFFNKHIENVI